MKPQTDRTCRLVLGFLAGNADSTLNVSRYKEISDDCSWGDHHVLKIEPTLRVSFQQNVSIAHSTTSKPAFIRRFVKWLAAFHRSAQKSGRLTPKNQSTSVSVFGCLHETNEANFRGSLRSQNFPGLPKTLVFMDSGGAAWQE